MGRRTTFLKPNHSGEPVEKFAPVDNPVEIRNLLEEAELTSAQVMVWLHNKMDILRSHFKGPFDPKSFFTIEVPSGAEAASFIESIGHQESLEVQVFIYLRDKAIFGFQTEILEKAQDYLKLKAPTKAYRVQRRKHQRYRVRQGYAIEVRYNNPKYVDGSQHRAVYDLSAGGLSFIIDHKEKDDYQVGMVLRHIQVSVRNRPILCDVEIRNIVRIDRPIGPSTPEEDLKNAKYKIGVQFRRVRPEDVEFLESYIIENTVQFK